MIIKVDQVASIPKDVNLRAEPSDHIPDLNQTFVHASIHLMCRTSGQIQSYLLEVARAGDVIKLVETATHGMDDG